jgi:hypothetical protein
LAIRTIFCLRDQKNEQTNWVTGMNLSAKQDIDAPANYVCAQIADFESWERAAMRRGVDIERADTLQAPGPGMSWIAKFRYRGRDRTVGLKVERVDLEGQFGFSFSSPQSDGVLGLELVSMAANRTRALIKIEVRPKTFTAKLFLQSLRLAKSRVDKTVAQRAAHFGAEIEDRYQRSQQR